MAETLSDPSILLSDCWAADVPRLKRRLREVAAADPRRWPAPLQQALAQSRERVAARAAARPVVTFPEELPVSARREEIARAIAQHQVVIVCGETGSGKTTQLPKLCLALGCGTRGLIGHTQPRRIAARATAARVAEELGSKLGEAVGYKIRFTDQTRPTSYIKLMTDGILLAETQQDRDLLAYDTLIIDEAHERSVNIDFLLGYLKQLLPRRPDLKLVITSATLDAERFARHFASGDAPAPVIEVSGRLYPIEMCWRPLDREGAERDLYDGIVDAVDEAQRHGPGDVLVFLPGEREIREASEALRKHHAALPGVKPEILPLYARQSAQEQQRVFQRSNGRRVVLATNVAETSLTVPGVRYVVDSGLARVKRYSPRNKVEQLQVEAIAQAAARQRAGRCGRVAEGVCFRLYAEDAFARRPAHTDPEILRSSLAGVILRMGSLGLGDVEDFPFIDAPPPRLVSDGYQLLAELGAVDEQKRLTPLGRELARLPLDPKIARMILAARDAGCLAEVLAIASALSVQDPRERPEERAGSADQAHAQFATKDEQNKSEFLWYWNLWQAFDAVWKHESSGRQRAWCKRNFLNWMRMREWRDVHAQLHVLVVEHGWKENTAPATFEQVHRALLAGLLGNVACRVEDVRPGEAPYLGARGIRFWPHPGSSLAKKAGKWIMAAELVDTTRLYARCLANIKPEWIEQVGAHLVKRSTYDPHWSKQRGEAMARERGVVYGLNVYTGRAVRHALTDPAGARELMIRDGLVAGEWPDEAARQGRFFQHNRRLIADIERLEEKQRRQDLLVDDELIFAFYDALIPVDVCEVKGFERWRHEVEREQPRLLFLEREQLMRHEAAGITTERFPATLEMLGQALKLEYRHEHGAPDDGVTLVTPLAMLNQLPEARLSWLVPGMLEEKVIALAKSVPQKIRHRLQPLAAFAEAFCEQEHDPAQPLVRALQLAIEDRAQLKLPLESFRHENLAPHLSMNIRVLDPHGRVLGQSRSLAELRARLKGEVERAFARAEVVADVVGSAPPQATPPQIGVDRSGGVATDGLTSWSFGALPELMEVRVDGRPVVGFPALEDCGEAVALRVFDTPERAHEVQRGGLTRLFALALKEQVRAIEKSLPGLRDLALVYLPFGTEAELKALLVRATLERTCLGEPWPTDDEGFGRRVQAAKPRVMLVAQELARLAGTVLAEHAALQKRLATLNAFPAVVEDVRSQLSGLLPRDFIAMPFERLQHLPRYLKAISVRLDKLRNNPARDAQAMAEWRALYLPFERELAQRRRAGVADPALAEFRWWLEELRVQLFAQELKTPMPVSVKRLQKIWDARPR